MCERSKDHNHITRLEQIEHQHKRLQEDRSHVRIKNGHNSIDECKQCDWCDLRVVCSGANEQSVVLGDCVRRKRSYVGVNDHASRARSGDARCVKRLRRQS